MGKVEVVFAHEILQVVDKEFPLSSDHGIWDMAGSHVPVKGRAGKSQELTGLGKVEIAEGRFFLDLFLFLPQLIELSLKSLQALQDLQEGGLVSVGWFFHGGYGFSARLGSCAGQNVILSYKYHIIFFK